MKIHRDIPQGSDAWFALRREIPTASCAKQIITKTGKIAAARVGYMNQLYAEAVVPEYAEDEITSIAIDWGNNWESVAREAYADITGQKIKEVAFVTTDDGRSGCSPDGLVFLDGEIHSGLEIKCPFHPRNHIAALAAGKMPEEHKPQVHWSMAVTGSNTWAFMSYFPGLPPLIEVIERDEYTAKVEAAMKQFGDEYAEFRKMMKLKMEQPIKEKVK